MVKQTLMPKMIYNRHLNPRRLTQDQLSTSSHVNIQVIQFYKVHAIITVLQNSCIYGLVSFLTFCDICMLLLVVVVVFFISIIFFLQFPKQITQNYLSLIPNRKHL